MKCNTSGAFKLNELVWVKYDTYPWWPGVIKKDISSLEYEILFCGDDLKAKILKTNIAKWEKNFDKFTKQVTDNELLFAIGIALKLQENMFDFKDHSDFISQTNKQEVIEEVKEFLSFNHDEPDQQPQQQQQQQQHHHVEYLNKKRNKDHEVVTPQLPPSPKDETITDIINSFNTIVHSLPLKLKKVNDLKNKISSRLTRSSLLHCKILPDNITTLSNLPSLTHTFIHKSFPHQIAPFLPSLHLPSTTSHQLLLTHLLNIQSLYQKDNIATHTNQYETIYDIFCTILTKINNLDRTCTCDNEETQAFPSLTDFIECVYKNNALVYCGVKFRVHELTNKHIKYKVRVQVRQVLFDIMKEMFTYLEKKFVVNVVGFLECLCAKVDPRVAGDYFVNVEVVINTLHSYTKVNTKLGFDIHNIYNLNLNY